ncbi:MAG TPA: gluconate 2-dehydrogenase subunit 3 family protein [Niastella sp.]|nr:gluconate 2-dehydrogenase subunit 3 family protein [Niastella sp.]
MQRRTVLKNLLFIAAGTVVIPSCANRAGEASIPLKHIKIDSDQEKLLAEICDTIIPKTAIPGAKDVYAHLFALNMIDDCYPEEQQQQFVSGLNAIDKLSKKKSDTGFIKSTPAQREALLADLDGRKKGDDLYDFYQMTKALTINGYLQSQYVMTNVLKYELVPGRYNGFAPVKTIHHQI